MIDFLFAVVSRRGYTDPTSGRFLPTNDLPLDVTLNVLSPRLPPLEIPLVLFPHIC